MRDRHTYWDPPANPRDWPQDRGHENGCYQCRCIHCGEEFIGHKRRVLCRTCWDEAGKRGPE